jgi:hypothetical protein
MNLFFTKEHHSEFLLLSCCYSRRDVTVSLNMLDIGYDEGGSSGTLLISAQLGSCGSILSFNRNWRKALKDAGNIPFFHAKDYANFRSGVFKGLSKTKRRTLLLRLAGLIHKGC